MIFGSNAHAYGSRVPANNLFITRNGTGDSETVIRNTGLDSTLFYDSDNDLLRARTAFHVPGAVNNPSTVNDITVNSGLTISIDGTRATLRGEYRGPFQTGTGYSYARNEVVLHTGRLWYNGSSGNINDPSSFDTSDWVLSAQPVQAWSSGSTYWANEMVYDTSGGLYRVVSNTSNAPALTNTTVFQRVGGGSLDTDAVKSLIDTEINDASNWTIDSDGNVQYKGGPALFTAVSTTSSIEIQNNFPGELPVVRVTSGNYRHYVKMTYAPNSSGTNLDGTLRFTRVNTGSNRTAQLGTPTATLTLTNRTLAQLQTTLSDVSTATYLTTAANFTWSNL